MPQKIYLRSRIKTFLKSSPAVILGILAVGVVVYAWTEPSASPPGGNVSAPLNVSGTSQYKSGALGVGGVLSGYGSIIVHGGLRTGNVFNVNIPSSCGGNWVTNADMAIWTPDHTGGCGDEAYIAHYVRSGEATTLEIANKNDADDHIALMPSGGVGIGTTAPSYKLDVQGGQVNASGGICIAGVCKNSWGEVGGYWTQSGSNLYPNNTAWNVGIGTINPVYKLDVSGNLRATDIYLTDGVQIEGLSGRNYFRDAEGAGNLRVGAAWGMPGIYAESGVGVLGGASGASLQNNALFVTTAGNVGIGTTSPAGKMDVNGDYYRAGTLFYNGTILYANRTNTAGGGVWISDDGGFYDYNNGYVDFRGSTGIRVLENDGSWGDNSIRAANLCLKDDCRSTWPSISETDPIWSGWRDNPSRSSLSGEIRSDTISACGGGSCSHLRWSGDNNNYLRGITYLNGDIVREGDWGTWLGGTNNPARVRVGELWGQSGVYGGTGKALFLGSDAGYVQVAGGNSFYVDGNVGIGTTGPGQKLEIVGGNLNLPSNGALIGLPEVSGNTAYTGLSMIPNGVMGDGVPWYFGIGREPGAWSFPYPDLVIHHHTGVRLAAHSNYGGISFYEALNAPGTTWSSTGAEIARFRDDRWGGSYFMSNVGIGTTGPSEKLQVVGNIKLGGTEGDIKDVNAIVGYNDLFIKSNSSENAAIYYAGSDQHFYTGGAERLTILNTGNVGIGTTGPNAKLDIAMGNDNIAFYQPVDNSMAIQAYIDGQWNNRTTYAGGCCNNLVLQPDVGNVGIGTASPAGKLDVNGDYYRAGSLFYNGTILYANRTNTAGGGVWVSDDGGFYDYNNSYVDFRGSTGIRVLENDGSWGDNSVRAANLCLKDDCRSTWPSGLGGSGTANYVAKFTAGTTLGNSQIYDNGTNVGIDTTSPGTKLDVAGTAAVDYLRVDPQDGVNEGGELQLVGAGAFGNFQIDNYQGHARIHTLAPGKQFQVLGGSVYADGTANNYFAGNVGIGTTGPGATLDVKGIIRANDGTVYAQLNPASAIAYFGTTTNHPLGLTANNTEYLRINAAGGGWWTGGNVGIGTPGPDARLEVVGGDIHMEAGRTFYSHGRMHIAGEELLFLLNKSGVVVSKAWGGSGDLTVEGVTRASGGLIIETRTFDPPSPVTGQMWLRTDF